MLNVRGGQPILFRTRAPGAQVLKEIVYEDCIDQDLGF